MGRGYDSGQRIQDAVYRGTILSKKNRLYGLYFYGLISVSHRLEEHCRREYGVAGILQ